MRVAEYGVDETLGDSLTSGEQLLALEASRVIELHLICVATCRLRSYGRVEYTHESASFCEAYILGRIASKKVSSAISTVA
jgi:hypothetical protein